MIIASEAKKFPFIVKMSSNEKKMKKQHKVFSIMQKLAEVDAHVGNPLFVCLLLILSVSTLNTILNKWSEIEKVTCTVGHCLLKNANL